MVPSAFVVLDELPLTANGKLDRRALPAPAAGTAGTEYMAPETDTERVLVAIWSEVLGAERVGTTDGYFELGGDSVQSLLISSQATALFDVAVSPREVMTARTVAGLAELVENKILSEVELAEFDDRSNDDRSRRPR
ncbi:hypothetical protein F1D05_02690 [Kribbella qitaiheensis]|uniref:Carrier domain-containing protein n=2 Tax=Kribbella qitaiheensis TaxID=1544730 RepID=A0A7G6WSQ2_9ACTN|nr:hypothetical protein F1D05_02690 [Kribbella qitaiheensis]